MKCAVTVSLVAEARGGPFVFWDDLEAACRSASEIGFDGIEIFAPSADAVPEPQLRGLLEKYQLGLAAMGTGAGWVKHQLTLTHPDPEHRSRAIDFVQSIMQRAAQFSAPAIIGSMQGRWGNGQSREATLERLSESLRSLAAYAQSLSVPLLYEPLNRYETNLLTRLEDATEFLKQPGLENVKLLADLFHMNIEEDHVPVALRKSIERIGHIHFVDSQRRPAGLGHLDWESIFKVLKESRYQGYLSAEAFPYPDPLEAAKRTWMMFQKYRAN